MKIDVILPTYNRADLLTRALDSALDATTPAGHTIQIIVVDNKAVQSGKFSLSSLLLSRATKQPRLFTALPLLANGAAIGVVSLTIDLTVFSEIIGHAGLEPGETVTVVSRSGIVFANRPQPPDLVGTHLDTSPIVRRALSEGIGTARMPDWTGREQMFAFSPIAETHGTRRSRNPSSFET